VRIGFALYVVAAALLVGVVAPATVLTASSPAPSR
jgi:hypothetical protein